MQKFSQYKGLVKIYIKKQFLASVLKRWNIVLTVVASLVPTIAFKIFEYYILTSSGGRLFGGGISIYTTTLLILTFISGLFFLTRKPKQEEIDKIMEIYKDCRENEMVPFVRTVSQRRLEVLLFFIIILNILFISTWPVMYIWD